MNTRGWSRTRDLRLCVGVGRWASTAVSGLDWRLCCVLVAVWGSVCVPDPQLRLAFTALSAPFTVDCVPPGCVWSWGFLEVSAALRVGPNQLDPCPPWEMHTREEVT